MFYIKYVMGKSNIIYYMSLARWFLKKDELKNGHNEVDIGEFIFKIWLFYWLTLLSSRSINVFKKNLDIF